MSDLDRPQGSIARLKQRALRPGLTRESLITYGFTGVALVANLGTGILIARLLGPAGRGEVTAITNAATWISLFFLLGCREAIAYHQAHNPEQGGKLFSTWLVLLIPTAGLGILVAELLIPLLFSAQTDEATRLAMLYMVAGIPLALLGERLQGFLLGDHDFVFWNVARVAIPLLTMAGYAGLSIVGDLTVTSALLSLLIATALVWAVSGVRVIGRHGMTRPSWPIGRTTAWYGLRGSAGDALALLNSRLDLLILPAFVGAASVGYYSVSTNVSWIIFMLASPLVSLVLPVAARRKEQGPATVIKALHVTLAGGVFFAVVVGALADIAVPAVYGSSFGPAVEPLRILLPGTVLYGGAMVLVSGLYAVDRPFTASASQLAGLIFTAVGLALFLESGGIQAAAIVSTTAYTVVFGISVVLYQRATGISWLDYLPRRRRRAAD